MDNFNGQILKWGHRIYGDIRILSKARKLGVTLKWFEPIKPGDTFLSIVNKEVMILVCKEISKNNVYPRGPISPIKFMDCVKIK
jgi:hypothetical protein